MGYLLSSYQLFQPHVFWSEAVLQGLQISHGVTYIGRLSPAGMSTLDQILRLNCCTPLYGYRQKWSCSCRGVTTLWCWHGSCVRLRHDARPFTFTEWNNGSPQPTSEWLWSAVITNKGTPATSNCSCCSITGRSRRRMSIGLQLAVWPRHLILAFSRHWAAQFAASGHDVLIATCCAGSTQRSQFKPRPGKSECSTTPARHTDSRAISYKVHLCVHC